MNPISIDHKLTNKIYCLDKIVQSGTVIPELRLDGFNFEVIMSF